MDDERQDRGAARRRQILDAAAACFARRGFHQTTMPEICRAAGLSPGTVYRYYRSKDDLIAALVAEDRAESLALLTAIGRAPDTLAAFAAGVDETFAAMADPLACAVYVEIIAEATRNPRVAALVREHDLAVTTALTTVVRRGQTRGEIDRSLDPAAIAEFLVALIDGLILRYGVAPDVDLTARAATVKTMLGRLLAPRQAATGAPPAGDGQ